MRYYIPVNISGPGHFEVEALDEAEVKQIMDSLKTAWCSIFTDKSSLRDTDLKCYGVLKRLNTKQRYDRVEGVPDDMPTFTLLAQDKNAALTLAYYNRLCKGEHKKGVNDRLREFVEFAHAHPERMKEPD